ncbi:MAG: class I SAM-dependent methyltransferase [Candidatus Paceibacterota bacterium]|jgi:methionine biosynthesis protein MetW
MNKTATYHKNNICFDYPATLKKIESVFDFDVPGLKILDLGCGDGRLSAELVRKGHEVWGVDIFPNGIEDAKKKGINAIEADIEAKLPFQDSAFDLVLALDTLEHLYDEEGVLKEVFRILKADGKVIISYPNQFDLRNRLNMLFGGGIIHWSHRKYKNVHSWSYGHIRFLLYDELEELLSVCGFYPKSIQFNFMAGGILPRRLIPSFIRKTMLRLWPQVLTGKYVILADKKKGPIKNKIYISHTEPGM